MTKNKLQAKMFTLFMAFFVLLSIKTTLAISADFVFETDTVRYVITSGGTSKSLQEKKTGQEWLKTSDTPLFSIKKQGKMFPASSLKSNGDLLRADFGLTGVQADFKISKGSDSIVIELVFLRGEGVEEVRLAQLNLARLEKSGNLIAARWNEKFIVSLMGMSEQVNSRIAENNLIVASVYPEIGIEKQKVAIIAVPTDHFMSAVQKVEFDHNLPSPKIGGEWAKQSSDVRESYLFTDLTEANAEETIRYAKLAGFKYILIYSSTWSTSLGSYPINTRNFPDGEKSLKAVIDKCHAAGLKVGMHFLTSFVGKNDPLVSPVPDSGLLKDAEAILAADLNVKTQEIVAIAVLGDFPRQQAFYGTAKAGMDIQIDDEIIHYSAIGGTNSNVFLQCTRGYAGTKSVAHKSGAKIYHLAERYGSYLADLRTPLKEKITERVAGLINRSGFDMIYFDGGEVNSANGPFWYWGSQQQMAIWRRVKRDLLVQGSGMTHWTWHIFSRGTCDDFASVASKEYLDYYKIPYAYQYRNNFMPAELGWWGFLEDALHHPATLPDVVEHYAIRMLALDAPISLETNLNALKANGRTEEMLKLLGKYERLRLQKSVPPSVRERLRTGEWHLMNSGGMPAFQPARYDVERIGTPREIRVLNGFGSQSFKFRLQAVSLLAEVGDRSNISLLGSGDAVILKPPEPKAVMPGDLSRRIEYKSLDLSTHRAIAVRLEIDSPLTLPGEPCAVLNIQLESGDKMYRDYYVDLDFTGERTIVIPESNTERMLREFPPAYANYAFKMAMYSFNYKNIAALNFRWMRKPTSKPGNIMVSLVEALSEKESVLENPVLSNGISKVELPIRMKTGDYAEYWGEGPLRVFNRNGVQLLTAEMPGSLMLRSGENRISLSNVLPMSAKLTTILLGDALKY